MDHFLAVAVRIQTSHGLPLAKLVATVHRVEVMLVPEEIIVALVPFHKFRNRIHTDRTAAAINKNVVPDIIITGRVLPIGCHPVFLPKAVCFFKGIGVLRFVGVDVPGAVVPAQMHPVALGA